MHKIRTDYAHPPIPRRDFDWQAWFDGWEEDGPMGSGRTEPEAIADLLQVYNDIYAASAENIRHRAIPLAKRRT